MRHKDSFLVDAMPRNRLGADMRLVHGGTLRPPSHKESSEVREGSWWPKQPALFALNETVDCPVPVFGRLPKGFLRKVVGPALGVARDEILHLCSGALRERFTVDVRSECRPWLVADAAELPLKDDSFAAIFLDPPYTPAWARQYGVKYPPTYPLLREAVRVCRPGGKIGIFHFLVPYTPKGADLLKVYGITVGMGYQIRAFTVFQKLEAS